MNELHVVFLLVKGGGPGSSSGKALRYGLDGRVRSRVSEGWIFSSLLRVQAGPGFHSFFYKLSTGE